MAGSSSFLNRTSYLAKRLPNLTAAQISGRWPYDKSRMRLDQRLLLYLVCVVTYHHRTSRLRTNELREWKVTLAVSCSKAKKSCMQPHHPFPWVHWIPVARQGMTSWQGNLLLWMTEAFYMQLHLLLMPHSVFKITSVMLIESPFYYAPKVV
jgi:hypothetical protein